MQRDPYAFLWDVREVAIAIQTFTEGTDAASYAATEMAPAAVEREFEIMGEALNQLFKMDALLAARIPDTAQIIAFRNQLIHGYANVNAGTVWNVVQLSLPNLLASVKLVLQEPGEAED